MPERTIASYAVSKFRHDINVADFIAAVSKLGPCVDNRHTFDDGSIAEFYMEDGIGLLVRELPANVVP